MIDLITDRTQADVNYALSNRDSNIPLKGAYNASDYNRVGNAINYLSNKLSEYGYQTGVNAKTDWEITDNFTPENGVQYLISIKILKDAFVVFSTTPQLPLHIHDIYGTAGHIQANNIEKILFDLDLAINLMIGEFIYSNEIYSGEDDFI